MSGPFGSQQWMYASGGFYPYELDNSLKFNSGDSPYLSRTPTSAGNRKTWTWSAWVKGDLLNTVNVALFDGGTTGPLTVLFATNGQLRYYHTNSGITLSEEFTTVGVYRDQSAWYHIVFSVDTTQATAADRVKIYVNGVEQSTTNSASSIITQNADTGVNRSGVTHYIGVYKLANAYYFDGYITEVNFIDGTALDPTSFGEFKEGIWIPKDPTGLTYGTNGFRLPFTETTTAEGFNTVTYTGTSSGQSIEGVGFQPDLVWVKSRSTTNSHNLFDSIRGAGYMLSSDDTAAEIDNTAYFTGFESDGFTVALNGGDTNFSGYNYVAWCWDAGTGSAASNTDGTITSTVKANQDYGFSIVTYTGTGSSSDTVGHGLGVIPAMVITKRRDGISEWMVKHQSLPTGQNLLLNQTLTAAASLGYSQGVISDLTSDTTFGFTSGSSGVNNANQSSATYVAYCFADVTGYQKIGTYTGTGSSGNAITGLGFRPAFLMVKRTDAAADWTILDSFRNPSNDGFFQIYPNLNVGDSTGLVDLSFDSDGFTIDTTAANRNASGGTYVYLAIADTRDAAFTSDASGNGNHWTPNALQHSDVMPDTPTDGFAVLNGTTSGGVGTLTEGNLVYQGASSQWESKIGTIGVSSGKWYFEVNPISGSSTQGIMFGLINMSDTYLGEYFGYYGNTWGYYGANGQKYNNAVASSYGAAVADGDIVGVALDADAGTLTFYKNGVSQGVAFSGLSLGGGYDQEWFMGVSCYGTAKAAVNFGQDSSFNANKIAQGNADENGFGDFYYAPPSGYLALCNANLPDPVIDPNKGDNPENYFNTVLWTGDNAASRSITGVGFQPDWVWAKDRSTAAWHRLFDSVRGGDGTGMNILYSNSTAAEDPSLGTNGSFSSIDSDGFTITEGSSSNSAYNGSSSSYVAWNWLAGGTGVSNTDGSITSTVSANTEAGFSVVTYTGTGANATVGHGLSSAPDMIIAKSRSDSSNNWMVFHTSEGATKFAHLNLSNAFSTASTVWQNTAPTSSVFSIGTANGVNQNTYNFVAYCFANKEGYSKFGSYTGNGSTDGPFVYTGFRPAFVIIKVTSTTNSWEIRDAVRDDDNPADNRLYADLSNAESSGSTVDIDFLSNGFKLRTTAAAVNSSGASYIYMAFAEQPFKYSNAR